MTIKRSRATLWGLAFIVLVVSIHAFTSFACYKNDLLTFMLSSGMFLGIPLIAAFAGLISKNPLRAIGACFLFIPWLIFAYHTDCIRPYAGGGASMIYVAVLIWGTPSAIAGALIVGPISRLLGLKIV